MIEETILTEAVIQNDVETVKRLRRKKEAIFAENSLGFNCIELAKFLDRKECLKLLSPRKEKTFKVKAKGKNQVETYAESMFQAFFKVRFTPNLLFSSYKFFLSVIKSTSWIFKQKVDINKCVTEKTLKEYEGEPELFTLRMQVYGKKIHSGYFAPVRIEWINQFVEYGLVADRLIKKGEFVGAYCGQVRRTAFWLLENAYSIEYPNQSWLKFLIDAKEVGNELRFVNHSFNPNLKTLVAADKGLVHSVYIASKDILKNEQLSWNYGEDFWAEREPPEAL